MKPAKRKTFSSKGLSMFEAMDHMMDDFWSRPFAASPFGDHFDMPRMKMPRVNMSETKNQVKVEAELPGCKSKDVEVSIEDDVLSIHAKKSQEKEKKDKKKHYYFHESSHQEFSRAIPLPSHVEAKKAKSKCKDGVLTITIPKKTKTNGEGKVKVKVA